MELRAAPQHPAHARHFTVCLRPRTAVVPTTRLEIYTFFISIFRAFVNRDGKISAIAKEKVICNSLNNMHVHVCVYIYI
jgi:hypothetical protein